MNIKFSIIVVCLNPGDKLKETLDSILKQEYQNYEIIVKDGGSTDKSVETIPDERRIRYYSQKDKSIYDAMNQAVEYATGDFYFFLNCGDYFYSEKVLGQVADFIRNESGDEVSDILYGNTYERKTDAVVSSAPYINGFTCYRNVPCHQTCFYSSKMFTERAYYPEYKVRGDYEHFLWCYYVAKAKITAMPIVISCYEGGGFSETKENRKRSKQEHKMITQKYMTFWERFKYRLILMFTLAPVRRRLAESKSFSGLYNKLKTLMYKK